VSCKSQPPSEIAPGEGGAASVVFAAEADARVHGFDPAIDLPLTWNSRTVELTLAFGETRSDEIRLVGRLAAAARLSVKSVDPPGPVVTVLPAEGTRPQGVRITMVGTAVGQTAGQVTLSTGLDDPKEITCLYSGKVVGHLTVDPTNPFIDLRAPPPAGVAIHVTSDRKDFRLDRAQIVDGPFEASVGRDAATGGYAVQVTLAPSGSNDSSRGAVGTLRLFSNDPAEPRKDVKVFALGPLNRGAAR
jgi:hypothetical protein